MKQYYLKFQKSEIIFLQKASQSFELKSNSLGLTLSLDSYFQELGSITPSKVAQDNNQNEIANIILESVKQENETIPCPPISDVTIKSRHQPDLLKGIPFCRGLPINRLIGLSRSFSLIGLGFGHLIF